MWIKIEIVSITPEQVEVMVTYANDDPSFMNRIDRMLREIAECWAIVHVKISRSSSEEFMPDRTPGKRGGPIGTPDSQRLEIVRGWLAIQGRMNQEVYAQSRGVAASTLRRWVREFRVEGKL